MTKSIYITGPMRNYPGLNHAAFDAAKVRGWRAGWCPISPADIYRNLGILSEDDLHIWEDQYRQIIMRDIDVILNRCEAVAVLPGWMRSKGAVAEVAVAIWAGKEILCAVSFEPLTIRAAFAACLSAVAHAFVAKSLAADSRSINASVKREGEETADLDEH